MRVEYFKIKVFFLLCSRNVGGTNAPHVLPGSDVHHHEHISDTQVLILVIPD